LPAATRRNSEPADVGSDDPKHDYAQQREKPGQHLKAMQNDADSVPTLSIAVPLSAALRLPGSAHRRVSERSIGSGQMSVPHQDFRGRPKRREPTIV
jgi:hypothetical protein